VDYILGIPGMDRRLTGICRLLEPAGDWQKVFLPRDIKTKLVALSKEFGNRNNDENNDKYNDNVKAFYFCGPYGTGKALTAGAFCREAGMPLLSVHCGDLLKPDLDFQETVGYLYREALLFQGAVFLDAFDLLSGEGAEAGRCRDIVFRVMADHPVLTFISSSLPWRVSDFSRLPGPAPLPVEFPVPSFSSRKRIWRLFLDGDGDGIDIDDLADTFRLTGGQIRDAVEQIRQMQIRGQAGNGAEDLYRSCRDQSNRNLEEKARKITPLYGWPDIILPPDTLRQLEEITLHVKHRRQVFGQWGFEAKLSAGKGLSVLFYGPSGTGKTMAAEVIARELGIDLYKIDLSCVVSKYIGETEKNLSAIFREAETANGILFFDEADALFGKRSEVKDSHDRYANIEIGYLLQRMEEYNGVVILATNMRKNMDEAFIRRMQFIVEFPFPEEESRRRIWQGIFPGDTPLDTSIDYEFLTRRLKFSGGNIKNIALASAFYAADDGGAVTMKHLVQACKREFQKMGKLCLKEDFGDYYEFVKKEVS
jgi:AAA+ superfamily predicted ATPase